MPIRFRQATAPGLDSFTGEVPAGAIVGLTGGDSAALDTLCRLAEGVEHPASGAVETDGAATLVLRHAFSQLGAFERARARLDLEAARRGGASILLLSHDPDLLRDLCDEVWWFEQGRAMERGEPRSLLESHNRHVAAQLADWSRSVGQPLLWSMRRGDGRAEILAVQTLDAEGRSATVWRSGEPVSVLVRVRFAAAVDDPVVGIMIRTRIGMEVFGTNTELERVRLGPVEAGRELAVRFDFRCDLCPQDYTLTAASHDPDGVWHDWMEDAVAFSVADSRYTAGVANLRARVVVERTP